MYIDPNIFLPIIIQNTNYGCTIFSIIVELTTNYFNFQFKNRVRLKLIKKKKLC